MLRSSYERFEGAVKIIVVMAVILLGSVLQVFAGDVANLPREKAVLTFAPEVPPPITRKTSAIVEVSMESSRTIAEIKQGLKYEYWGFNGHVPGPFIRVREGDVLEIHHTSADITGMPHNIDFHAVTGPGGGAPVTTAVKGEEKVAWFKMLQPGLFIYHCAAPPVMDHIANGMYGLILVEPKKGLPKVDKEFYVLQSEFYPKRTEATAPAPEVDHSKMAEKGEGAKAGAKEGGKKDDFWGDTGAAKEPELLTFSHQEGLNENPTFVVFNGKYNSLVGEGALKAKTGDRVRIFFGNAGPNLISSFHVIGEIFENVYREGDLVSSPAHSVQTTLVPAGGSTVVEFGVEVPGNYTLVDHAIFRIEKGAVGFLTVEGEPRHDIYLSKDDATPCKGCMVHP